MWGKLKNKVRRIFKVKPTKSEIFNVETFNVWYCDPKNGSERARLGTYLKINNLSAFTLIEYIYSKFDVTLTEVKIFPQDLDNFLLEIKNDWELKNKFRRR